MLAALARRVATAAAFPLVSPPVSPAALLSPLGAVRHAQTKAGGTCKNGHKSAGKRLGVKRQDGTTRAAAQSGQALPDMGSAPQESGYWTDLAQFLSWTADRGCRGRAGSPDAALQPISNTGWRWLQCGCLQRKGVGLALIFVHYALYLVAEPGELSYCALRRLAWPAMRPPRCTADMLYGNAPDSSLAGLERES